MLFRIWLLLVVWCCHGIPVAAQQGPPLPARHLAPEWQLIQNNYNGKEQFQSWLRLTNQDAAQALPPSGWTIFFNATRNFLQKDVGHGIELTRVQGRLFCLKPTAAFTGLPAGGAIDLNLIADAWAFNYSYAPNGFYLVWDTWPDKGFDLQPVDIYPPDGLEKFKHSAKTKTNQCTPEAIFEQNSRIKPVVARPYASLMPAPEQITLQPGTYRPRPLRVACGHPAFSSEARWLSAQMPQANPSDTFRLEMIYRQALASEGYQLDIRPDKVVLYAYDAAGMFYGAQTWLNILRLYGDTLMPCALIEDEPRFAYRGLHLDVARHYQPKAAIIDLLRQMATYKLNTFHFHFNDDEAWRLAISHLPELTDIGACRGHNASAMPPAFGSGADVKCQFYTRQDYLDILQEARRLHIEVIPEIELPGHARAAIRAMEARYTRLMQAGQPEAAAAYRLIDPADSSVYLSPQLFSDNVVCMAQPGVYRFAATVLDTLIALHREAGMPLKTIHLGGDEVPVGAWEKSPLCQVLKQQIAAQRSIEKPDLWTYFWEKMDSLVSSRRVRLAGWEEIGMHETRPDGKRKMDVNPALAHRGMLTYVWNTVAGWGNEDLAYRMANAGYQVVVCDAPSLYLNLGYQQDFAEPGYNWGGFVDLEAIFSLIPTDHLRNKTTDRLGNPVDPTLKHRKQRLTEAGAQNIQGIQGHLWSENIPTPEMLEYMAFPKLLALAERAWAAEPDWATTTDSVAASQLYQQAWSSFVQRVGANLATSPESLHYRIPMVGVRRINEFLIEANVQLPHLTIHYTTNGREPTILSPVYQKPVISTETVRFRAFDAKGRGGR